MMQLTHGDLSSTGYPEKLTQVTMAQFQFPRDSRTFILWRVLLPLFLP